MKSEVISKALSDISDRHIEEAADFKAKKKGRPWIKWTAAAACVCLAVGYVALSGMFNVSHKRDEYYFVENLTYTPSTVEEMDTDGGRIIFNEITDMDTYGKFNIYYADSEDTYYMNIRTAVWQLTIDDAESIYGYNYPKVNPTLLELESIHPEAWRVLNNIADDKNGALNISVTFDEQMTGISFIPLVNSEGAAVISEDLSAFDERYDSILSILRTGESSLINGINVNIHYFYLIDGDYESYIYYAYFEKDGMEYLYQLTSSRSRVYSKSILEFTDPQGNCRQAFADYLLAILS